jgi:UDP-glucose 4-epimerase
MYHKEMTVVGNGSKRRDYTYVGDVINANILSLKQDGNRMLGEAFNVGTGKNYSPLEIVKMIGGEFTYIKDRPAEAQETLADISKIKDVLGWYPKIALEHWIEEFKKGDDNV